jgi:hypothetical protein
VTGWGWEVCVAAGWPAGRTPLLGVLRWSTGHQLDVERR